jgi:3-hydroxyisobutyrate dehydrogenase-like beta-hydroxyacid dehydrogenase
LPSLLSRDFAEPHFTTQMFLKDAGLIVEEGHELHLRVAMVEAMKGLVQTAIDQGLAHADYSSVYNVIAPE